MTKVEVPPTLREQMLADPLVQAEELGLKIQLAKREKEWQERRKNPENRTRRPNQQEDFARNHFDVHPL